MLPLIALIVLLAEDTATVDLRNLQPGQTMVLVDGKQLQATGDVSLFVWAKQPRATKDCVTQIYSDDRKKTAASYDWRRGASVLMTIHEHADNRGDHSPMILISGDAVAKVGTGIMLASSNDEADAVAAEFKALQGRCAVSSPTP